MLALLPVGCYEVPVTGRQAFNLMPEPELAQQASLAFQQMKAQTPLSRDATANAMVQRVGQRIAEAAGPDIQAAQWEFVVFDDARTINAFAMPGGKVAVYTGLLAVCETEDDLAIILGHEIAHVSARHGGERLTQQLGVELGGVLLGEAIKKQDQTVKQAVLQLYGFGSQLGVILPFSRQHETEADRIGLSYSAKAGYDPARALVFWRKMASLKTGRNQPPEWMSTHPSDERRLRDLEAQLPAAQALYEAARRR